MTTEKQIVHENGDYWVCDADNQYTVYLSGVTHSVSDSSYPRDEDGLSLAIYRCDGLAKRRAMKQGNFNFIDSKLF